VWESVGMSMKSFQESLTAIKREISESDIYKVIARCDAVVLYGAGTRGRQISDTCRSLGVSCVM
jgi:hypothetical protein